jgi:hypothetical protein
MLLFFLVDDLDDCNGKLPAGQFNLEPEESANCKRGILPRGTLVSTTAGQRDEMAVVLGSPTFDGQ